MPKRKTALDRNSLCNNRKIKERKRSTSHQQPQDEETYDTETQVQGRVELHVLDPRPQAYDYNEHAFHNQTDIGPMSIKCKHCGALKFKAESPGFCCASGKTVLPTYPKPPPYLASLLNHDNPDSEHFLNNNRMYNNAFQMTSFGCNRRQLPGWDPTFTVQGQVCHRIGSIYPPQETQPQNLQIYFIDNIQAQIQNRLTIANQLRPQIVAKLNDMFHEVNKYVHNLKIAADVLKQIQTPDLSVVIHEDKRPSNQHARRYNVPTSDEIGIVMPNEPTSTRDIVLHQRDGSLKQISELHRAYDALQYPVLFPHGTDGYNIYLQTQNGRKITQMQYYSYHIMYRIESHHLLLRRRLYQQHLITIRTD
jgi:hypothetical protein